MRFPRTILGTACIPWTEDGEFEEGIFRRQVQHLVRSGLRDLYIFGTAGEGYAVTDRQFERITAVFAETMQAEGTTPMVGLISLSQQVMAGRIEVAYGLGVRDFQISLPSWGPLNDSDLERFFDGLCGRFGDCRFLHYNLLRTKRLVTAREYAKLAERHPNLVATKHGMGDLHHLTALFRHAGQLRHFVTEPGFPYCSQIGEPGYLISIGSLCPERAREYFDAAVEGNLGRLLELQAELGKLSELLHDCTGAGVHMDGAFDKVFCRAHDDLFPLRLLPPYQGFSEEEFQRFKAGVREHFPAWLPG